MKILSTPHPEVQELHQYLNTHPDLAFELAIKHKQDFLVIAAEYQKLQTEYLKLKAQTKTSSTLPVSTLIFSFIASIKITKLSFRRGRKT